MAVMPPSPPQGQLLRYGGLAPAAAAATQRAPARPHMRDHHLGVAAVVAELDVLDHRPLVDIQQRPKYLWAMAMPLGLVPAAIALLCQRHST
jgi:hypothetical protein